MKKIAIITLNGYSNYGNRLQNYAMQEVLKSLNFNVETIINDRTISSNISFKEKVNNFKKNSIEEIFTKTNNKILRKIRKSNIDKRTEVFKTFTLDYINETSYIISKDNIPEKLNEKYDYFITGSDQVWNPLNLHGSSVHFLTFAEKKKRISYAPSFGVSQIETQYVKKYKKWISGIHRLSVREDDGAKIIKDLTGREADILVDPTLLINKHDWLAISKEADNKPKGEYLLTYFLGGIPKEYEKQINDIIKENDLEVINLGDIKEKKTYETGPSEFIDYVNSCNIFCTDSFHGVVFAILLEKPFIVYKRIGTPISMYSRIDTLLEKFRLSYRKSECIEDNKEIFEIDYSHIPSIVELEYEKSMKFLKEALNISE